MSTQDGSWEAMMQAEDLPTRVRPLLISRSDASLLLNVSLDTFERHIQPELRTVRVGRRVLVPVAQIEQWIARRSAVGGWPA